MRALVSRRRPHARDTWFCSEQHDACCVIRAPFCCHLLPRACPSVPAETRGPAGWRRPSVLLAGLGRCLESGAVLWLLSVPRGDRAWFPVGCGGESMCLLCIVNPLPPVPGTELSPAGLLACLLTQMPPHTCVQPSSQHASLLGRSRRSHVELGFTPAPSDRTPPAPFRARRHHRAFPTPTASVQCLLGCVSVVCLVSRRPLRVSPG